jgi:hypothetical protein
MPDWFRAAGTAVVQVCLPIWQLFDITLFQYVYKKAAPYSVSSGVYFMPFMLAPVLFTSCNAVSNALFDLRTVHRGGVVGLKLESFQA